ncbi:MAG: SDR family oxidoreductase [Candidatus Omnitrophica bacterium]|nr:SDR family oxidoreductase [Candidatus Omnitrophota bacterium]
MEKFLLNGKVAFVTGGAGLIGSEISKALAGVNAHTVLLDIDREKGALLEKDISCAGYKANYEYFDIAKIEETGENIRKLIKKYNGIDIWINAAYPRTKDWGDFIEDVDVNSWRKNIDMHLNGYFFCCQKAAEYMKEKKSGVIINFASIYGIVGADLSIYDNTEMTMPAAYSAIKGGIITFTKYLAACYGKYNIRVNSISPGGVCNKQPGVFVERYSKKNPLGRMADKEDIIGGVIYLASDASGYVTGHNLVVDGGWTAI